MIKNSDLDEIFWALDVDQHNFYQKTESLNSLGFQEIEQIPMFACCQDVQDP